MSRQILNGWKEISHHIRRSVRTVQRWEARLGLPVYRPALKDRSAVVAFSDELDRWISRALPDAGEDDTALNDIEENDAGLLRMLDNISTMALDTAQLSSQMRLLQEQLRQSLRIYHHRIASKTPAHTSPAPGREKGSLLPFRSQQRGFPVEGVARQRERARGFSLGEAARHKG
jgi:hypothetical protein